MVFRGATEPTAPRACARVRESSGPDMSATGLPATLFFFFQAEDGIRDRSRAFLLNRSSDLILKRRGCLTVPRLTLMSLIKMMLVMVSVAAISKTFGLLRFLLRLSFLAK